VAHVQLIEEINMDRDAALSIERVVPGVSLAQASPWHTAPVTRHSPALEVMTDLTLVKAASILPAVTLRQAEQSMIYQGVRMLFVVTEMPSVEGLITTTDLRGDRAMRIVQQRGVRYDELIVADVMTPLAMLDAVDLDAMRRATVSNVIATLQRHGRNHLLVVEGSAEHPPQRVRGIISRAQIERQLGAPIVVPEIAHSFAELGQMLS
jgi:CBS domain-containing protein